MGNCEYTGRTGMRKHSQLKPPGSVGEDRPVLGISPPASCARPPSTPTCDTCPGLANRARETRPSAHRPCLPLRGRGTPYKKGLMGIQHWVRNCSLGTSKTYEIDHAPTQ